MKTKLLSIVIALMVVCTAVWAEKETAWFDFQTCAFCKNFDLGAGEYLVDHMQGKYHTMTNGILAIMVIEDEYKDKFAKANEAMMKVGEEMETTGKVPQMCGHCTKYGELFAKGAQAQDFSSDVAIAYMMTADNPELVKELHAFAEKNNAEMAKWDAERAAAMSKKAGK